MSDIILSQPIKHFDITKFDARSAIAQMADMSFTARQIAKAATIFNAMLQDTNCKIILAIAGSSSSAGCMKIYADLIRFRMIDAVVATGATLFDMDFFEAIGFRHYRGSETADDNALHKSGINRIYDTFVRQQDLQECDELIKTIADAAEPGIYSSRAFIHYIGEWLATNRPQTASQSLLASAFLNKIPVFCPALNDCSAGIGLALHQQAKPFNHVQIDVIRDLLEFARLHAESKCTGLFIVGGGVPKNFVQDAVVVADRIGYCHRMHEYAIQVTVADSRDGGASGSTLSEAHSWGKLRQNNCQNIFGEATIVVPLLASEAYHQGHWRGRPYSA